MASPDLFYIIPCGFINFKNLKGCLHKLYLSGVEVAENLRANPEVTNKSRIARESVPADGRYRNTMMSCERGMTNRSNMTLKIHAAIINEKAGFEGSRNRQQACIKNQNFLMQKTSVIN